MKHWFDGLNINSTQSLFPFRELPVDQLSANAAFQRQSRLMGDFLAQIVALVRQRDWLKMDALCKQVGQRHARLTSVDFETDWWQLFISATLDTLKLYFDAKRSVKSG